MNNNRRERKGPGGIFYMIATFSVLQNWSRRLLSIWSSWFGLSCLRPRLLFLLVFGLVCFPLFSFMCFPLSSLTCWNVCRFSSSPCMHVFGGRSKGRYSFRWLWLSLVFISRFCMVCSYMFFIYLERKVLVSWLRHVPALKVCGVHLWGTITRRRYPTTNNYRPGTWYTHDPFQSLVYSWKMWKIVFCVSFVAPGVFPQIWMETTRNCWMFRPWAVRAAE